MSTTRRSCKLAVDLRQFCTVTCHNMLTKFLQEKVQVLGVQWLPRSNFFPLGTIVWEGSLYSASMGSSD